MKTTWRPDCKERIPDCLLGILQKTLVKFSKVTKIRKLSKKIKPNIEAATWKRFVKQVFQVSFHLKRY